MRRFFLKNVLFVILVNFLIKPVWIFFIDRTVQNTLGAGTYGSYMALFNLALIFNIIMDFGLAGYHTKMVSQDRSQLPTLFPSFFWARILLALVYALLVTSVGYLMGYSAEQLFLLGGVMVIQGLSALVLFLRSGIAALHRFRADSLFAVLDKLLMILICGTILLIPAWAAGFRLQWFVLAQQVSYAITAIAAFVVLTQQAGVPLTFRFNAAVVKRVLRASVPYALLIFLMSIYIRADMILLENIYPNGNHEAGLYYAGFRLLDAANVLGISLAGVLLPLFGKMMSDKVSVVPIVQLSTQMLLPFSFVVALVGVFYGQEIMEWLMHDNAHYSGTVLGLLMCTFPAYCLMYIYSTLLTAMGALKKLISFAAVAVVLNLLLNAFLIPTKGAVGAAFTALVTQWMMALCSVVACVLFWKMKISLRHAFRYVLFVGILLLQALFMHRFVASWMGGIAGMGVGAIVLYGMLGFFSRSQLSQLIKWRALKAQ